MYSYPFGLLIVCRRVNGQKNEKVKMRRSNVTSLSADGLGYERVLVAQNRRTAFCRTNLKRPVSTGL